MQQCSGLANGHSCLSAASQEEGKRSHAYTNLKAKLLNSLTHFHILSLPPYSYTNAKKYYNLYLSVTFLCCKVALPHCQPRPCQLTTEIAVTAIPGGSVLLSRNFCNACVHGLQISAHAHNCRRTL